MPLLLALHAGLVLGRAFLWYVWSVVLGQFGHFDYELFLAGLFDLWSVVFSRCDSANNLAQLSICIDSTARFILLLILDCTC